MNSIYVCFNLISSSSSIKTNEELEKEYQAIYKPLAKFLFSHSEVNFSFHFSGSQILFFKKKRKEFITILNELINRKQVEIIGDGFYSPIFPLILPADRNSQLDMLSSEIRQTFGKRPRGISIFQDVFDSSLINNLQMSGIEYVIIENSLLNKKNRNIYTPLIVSYLGKNIELIPTYTTDINNVIEIENLINNIKISNNLETNKILHINLEFNTLDDLQFKSFLSFLENFSKENYILSTIANYRKTKYVKKTSFISNDSKLKKSELTLYEHLDNNINAKYLYDRILFTSLIINQYKQDKMRKKAAREKLWQAQNGYYIINSEFNEYKRLLLRQQAYKFLIEADKILKEDGTFYDSVSSFDYNCDGYNEYICRMKKFFSTIDSKTASIKNLELAKTYSNYADKIDTSCNSRGLFNDYLISTKDIENFINNETAFSQITNYSELKYNQNHKDIQFENSYNSAKEKIHVYIKKRYIINSNGITVQYIVKNNSNDQLNTNLFIESSLMNNNIKKVGYIDFNIELITKESKLQYTSDKEILNEIDIIRITDLQNSIVFSIETNESCNFILNKNDYKDAEGNMLCSENVPYIYWPINLKPGMEIEKSINFTITEELKKNLLKKIQ